MHDPMYVAFEIRRPWPTRSAFKDKDTLFEWKRGSCFMTVLGRGYYFPGLITIWHNEPGGRDSGEICGYPKGLDLLSHLSHLSVQIHPVQAFRRWAFTRCAWCGGPSRKGGGNYINISVKNMTGYIERKSLPWWYGEQGSMHMDCSSVANAWRHCVCPEPDLKRNGSGYGWSWCSLCGNSRWHNQEIEKTDIYAYIRRHTNKGERPAAEVMENVKQMWKVFNESKEQSDV